MRNGGSGRSVVSYDPPPTSILRLMGFGPSKVVGLEFNCQQPTTLCPDNMSPVWAGGSCIDSEDQSRYVYVGYTSVLQVPYDLFKVRNPG